MPNLQVSVLFNEPKLLKRLVVVYNDQWESVSVLFNEPKLLKENYGYATYILEEFQCSSTSRNC